MPYMHFFTYEILECESDLSFLCLSIYGESFISDFLCVLYVKPPLSSHCKVPVFDNISFVFNTFELGET